MKKIYKIKDSVDLFLTDGELLTVYYMNSRQRKSFRVSSSMVQLIEQIDGEHTFEDIVNYMQRTLDVSQESVLEVICILEQQRIIVEKINNDTIISFSDALRYDRQINYFQEFFQNDQDGLKAQQKLFETQVLLFGCGAVGGDIAIILAMAGIRSFTFYDCDTVTASDVARHMFFQKDMIGMQKGLALGKYLKRIDSKVTVKVHDEYMTPQSDVTDLIRKADFVINTLDEPYIGYTASKISRVCVKLNKPHYIGGGFDAHLASTGELIIPYITPCVECYAKYFKQSLKHWKPMTHPVKVRHNEIGGLAAMTLFSSSFAAIEILKAIVGLDDVKTNYKIRGEFLFDDMDLTYLNVTKDDECLICGGNNET